MGKKEVTRIECDSPNCDKSIEIAAVGEVKKKYKGWKEVSFGSNEASLPPEPQSFKTRVLCPKHYDQLNDFFQAFFEESKTELGWSYTVSEEEVKR